MCHSDEQMKFFWQKLTPTSLSSNLCYVGVRGGLMGSVLYCQW